MFRLIAIALVSTFALLGVMGADQPSPYRQSGMLVDTGNALAGERFVVQVTVPMTAEPSRSAQELAVLVRGTPLLVLNGAPRGFAHVRDHAGRSGYVAVAALAPAP